MSVEQNKATLRRIYEEVWNKENMSVVPELISPMYLHHAPTRDYKGPEGFKEMVTSMRVGSSDVHYSVDDMVGEGDKLAARISCSGTFDRKMGNIEPTHMKFNYTGAIFYRYRDGKCVEASAVWDWLTLYQQIGVTPPIGERAASRI